MTNQEYQRRIVHASMRPELYRTAELDLLASDANFYGMFEEEADLRRHVEQRRRRERTQPEGPWEVIAQWGPTDG